MLLTLVPEVFLIFPRVREPRSGESESRSDEKEKPLVTLDLNLAFTQTPAVKLFKFIITKKTNRNSVIKCLSAPGNCSYNNPFRLGWWRVISLDLLTGVNRVFPVMKSAEKTPLKSTKLISNDYCGTCRINLKISDRSNIKMFGSKRDKEEFLKTLSLVLLSEINDTTGMSHIVCQKCKREVLNFSRVLEQGKELTLFWEKCIEAFRNQLEEYNLKRQKRCAREGSVIINITTEHVSSLLVL